MAMNQEMDELQNQQQETENTTPEVAAEPQPDPLETTKAELAAEHDKLLRLAAEFDNYRARTTKEKERIYHDAKAEVTGKFLPVYDNLARALAAPTTDEAYRKGVEMTMNGLMDILTKLDVEVYGDLGETFDPAFHNAVMHSEDETLAENCIAEVFQKGFRIGDKVVRFAMVKVAN